MSKREEIVRLVLTEHEKAALKAAADARGLPLAVWVRMVALEAARPKPGQQ